jgi:hypothetical protein
LLEKDESSVQEQIVIWVSKQGYMIDLLLQIEDEDGEHLNVQFYPFLEPALVSDETTPF